MPAISNQMYGVAAVANMQGTMPSRQGQLQTQRTTQGNAPYSVELSQAALQESARPRQEPVAPELLKALNNDVTRTQDEMSRAISDNHLHIQGMFSDNATSSFNFFGVSMPLATTSFELPKIQSASVNTANSSDNADSGNSVSSNPAGKTESLGAPTVQTAPGSGNEVQPPTGSSGGQTLPRENEVVKTAQENVMKHFDNFAAQVSGTAVATTASPAGKTAQ